MGTTKVIIFEDELLLANDLKRQIAPHGFEVSAIFARAEEGLAYLEKVKNIEELPEIILMDVTLAGPMNGFEAARRITACYSSTIVFLSGMNLKEDLDQSGSDGQGKFFLLKPVDITRAIVTLNFALRSNHTVSQSG
jgi:DNA-binding response OmpR family regulator